MSISIEDYEIKQPVLVADSFKIDIESVELHKTAKMRVSFMKDDKYLSSDVFFLTQEEYDAWGDDDGYLETLVIKKYGFVVIPDE